jgi:hypothetical protein
MSDALDFFRDDLHAACVYVTPDASPEARDTAERFLLAIAFQESGLRTRIQVTDHGDGPAASFLQFERGGIQGLMRHAKTREVFRAACMLVGCAWDVGEIHALFKTTDGDWLAAVAGRLNLLWYPKKLPTTQNDAWGQYLEIWRPGKPHESRWASSWGRAGELFG